ncbi:MAG: hypothetical protein RJA70_3585 [Pseudomonadota bacterium]|jgi:hypothetical protein
MQQLSLASLALFSGLTLLGACGSTGSTSGLGSSTYLEVSPAEFEGADCKNDGGEWEVYTATLVDVTGQPGTFSANHARALASAAPAAPKTDEAEPVEPLVLDYALPTSPPTRCHLSVRFVDVVPASVSSVAHSYIARIAAYDRADLKPVAPGSPLLTADGRLVRPRWEGTCGELDEGPDGAVPPEYRGDAGVFQRAFEGAVEPQSGRTVRLRNCSLRAVLGGDAR